MTVKIQDSSDKGKKYTKSKALKYEVGVYHTNSDNEKLDLIAKFRCYGDALRFATFISNGNVYFAAVVIR